MKLQDCGILKQADIIMINTLLVIVVSLKHTENITSFERLESRVEHKMDLFVFR